MSAPDVILGKAARALDKIPSEDWLVGFDAGFDAGAALMKEFKELADDLVSRLGKIKDTANHVCQLSSWADSEIRRQCYRRWDYEK